MLDFDRRPERHTLEKPFEDVHMLPSTPKDNSELLEGAPGASSADMSMADYRDLFDNASDLVQRVTPGGSYQYANQAWLTTLGYAASDLPHLTIADVLHPVDLSSFEAQLDEVMQGGPAVRLETRFVSKDGRVITVEGNVNCQFEGGSPVATRGIYRDISDRREVERLRDRFVSVVSHEIRNPLSSLQCSLELVLSSYHERLPEDALDLLNIALSSSRRLIRLTNRLLDAERLAVGQVKPDLSACSMAVLMQCAADEMRGLATKNHIRLEVTGEGIAWADPDRVVQVLTNLIGNAIKFSPADSVVRLFCAPDGEFLRVGVQDQGRGIPSDQLERVFQRFTQVQASDASVLGGAGLGLSIARRIVVDHGGRIWVESEEGHGSTFLFTLPIRA
jgi:PAS domain S-box-containing protein